MEATIQAKQAFQAFVATIPAKWRKEMECRAEQNMMNETDWKGALCTAQMYMDAPADWGFDG